MGMKIEIMRKNPNVCFEVDEMKSFTNWKSVIAWGEYQELSDQRDRFTAISLFADRTMHTKLSKTAIAPEINEGKGSSSLKCQAHYLPDCYYRENREA